MFFKSFYIRRLGQIDLGDINAKLARKPFVPCGTEQAMSMGFVPVFDGTEELAHEVNGKHWIRLAVQKKVVPASAVREELENRVKSIESEENRKVSKREQKDLRENIEFEMLGRALTQTKHIDAWIDQHNSLLVINSPSETEAEEYLLKSLRISLESLPVTPLHVDFLPADVMTNWLKRGYAPSPFELGSSCELKSSDKEGGTVTFKSHELTDDAVQTALQSGKYCSKLGLVWDEKISFVLRENMQLTNVSFMDILHENVAKQEPESAIACQEIEFELMTSEAAKLIKELTTHFAKEGEE